MEFKPLYRIRITARDDGFKVGAVLHCARKPTVDEVIAALIHHGERNEAATKDPEFTDLIGSTLVRLGLPDPPSGCNVGRATTAADASGTVEVTLAELLVLPD